MSDIFISYSRADSKKAKALAHALEEYGWSVWWDIGILPGSTLPFDEIDKQISSAKCVLVLWSKNSVLSEFVRMEAAAAQNRKILVPVIIDKDIADTNIPFEFRYLTTAKLVDWDGGSSHQGFQQLAKAIMSRTKNTHNLGPRLDLKEVRWAAIKLALLLIGLSVLVHGVTILFPKSVNDNIGWDAALDKGDNKLKITSVTTDGLAAEKLNPGDELIVIDQGPELHDDGDFAKAKGKIEPGKSYSMIIRRDGNLQAVTLRSPHPHVTFEKENFVLALTHVLVVSLFIWLIFTPVGIPQQTKAEWDHISRGTFKQFIKGWVAAWVSWLLVYLYMGIGWYLAHMRVPVRWASFEATIDLLNISNSAVFFYIFLVLDMPSVPSEDNLNRHRDFQKSFAWIIGICCVVFLVSLLGRLELLGLQEAGPYLSGFLVAISMAYVAGRLDSHYMSVRRLMLAPLYFYAVIQVIGPILFGLQALTYQALFFGVALAMKLYLFIIFSVWLHDGSFEKYFNEGTKSIENRRRERASYA